MAEMGLLGLATAGNVIRLLPPLNVKDSELEEAFEIIDESLEEVFASAGAGEGDAEAPDPEEAVVSDEN